MDAHGDGSLPFPVTATTVRQGTPPNSSQLTDVLTSVTTKTGQQTLNAGSVGYDGGVPTITTVTHTLSRPVDTTGSISSYPDISMGLNLPGSRPPTSYCGFTLPASASNAMSWSRPPWSQGYPYSGFPGQGFHGQGFPDQGFPNQVFPSHVPGQPFPGFWPYCGPVTTPVIVPQGATYNLSVPAPPLAVSSSSCSSVSVPAALPTSSVRHQFNQVTDSGPSLDGLKSILDDFRQSISSELTSFSNRLGTLENNDNKSNSPVISLLPDHNIGSDPEDSDEQECFSVAPGSQYEGFTSDEEGDNSVQVSQNVSQFSVPVSISSSVMVVLLPIPVYKALGASQLLIMGSIANCTLSKRAEILDKAKVSDNLKDALIKSPLDDKIFGLPLNEVQKHLSQTPAPVKVNVFLSGNNSKRGSYSSARGSSYNSQEKRRKMTNDGGNKGGPKKSSISRSKPNSLREVARGPISLPRKLHPHFCACCLLFKRFFRTRTDKVFNSKKCTVLWENNILYELFLLPEFQREK
ncbi:unnamed protein product [Mytilus coruscus]|uniref:Uncharacterized protein n=1 Tax=Mytilus coruscus TaxID=42192 RepID=A0A6J8AY38_MYTCO|nr:unnamed protein product [Mytilus coruscus]